MLWRAASGHRSHRRSSTARRAAIAAAKEGGGAAGTEAGGSRGVVAGAAAPSPPYDVEADRNDSARLRPRDGVLCNVGTTPSAAAAGGAVALGGALANAPPQPGDSDTERWPAARPPPPPARALPAAANAPAPLTATRAEAHLLRSLDAADITALEAHGVAVIIGVMMV